MKKLISVLFVLLISEFISAQKISVNESKLISSAGEMDAFEVWVPKCNVDDIEKSIEKWLKSHNGDVSNKKGEIAATNVVFKEFYQTPVTVYSKVEQSGSDVKLKMSVDAGAGFASIKSQPDLYLKFQTAIRNLAVTEAKDAAQKRLDTEQKQLDKLNGDMSQLKKDKEHLQKEIDDCNATIEKNKQSIQTNDGNQTTKTSELGAQDQKVKQLTDELNGIQ